MGHNSDKLYVTHSEHAAGSHTASSFGKRQETGKSEFQRLPLYVFIRIYSLVISRKLIAYVGGIVIAVRYLFSHSRTQWLLSRRQKREKHREQMSLTF